MEQEDYIGLDQCKEGFLYRIRSRNLSHGVYNGKGGFIGIREKFGQEYLFTEYHWDQGPPYGTVHPKEEVCKLPDNIALTEDELHEKGHSWAEDPLTKEIRPVSRHDLAEGEEPHGERRGFVDEWADTGERLPDDLYPFIRGNKALFDWLKEKEEADRKAANPE